MTRKPIHHGRANASRGRAERAPRIPQAGVRAGARPPRERDTSKAAGELAPSERRRWTRIGVLAALALLLGYLEALVPIPIPGVKLGLANVAVLVALATGDVGGAACVAAVKVVAGSLLFGSPVTLAYSATGAALAFVVMAPLSRLPSMRLAMTSVVGAVAHEMGQLCVAAALLGTAAVWLAAPPLLVAAIVTGALCGGVATSTLAALDTPNADADAWARDLWRTTGDMTAEAAPKRPDAAVAVDARVAVVALVAVVVALLHTTGVALAACVAIAIAACAVTHVNPRRAARALRPTAAIALVAAVAQAVTAQGGTIVARIGVVTVSDAGLAAAAYVVARLLGTTAASLAFTQATTADDVMAALTWALAPLSGLGGGVTGLELALGTALKLAPALVGAVGTLDVAPIAASVESAAHPSATADASADKANTANGIGTWLKVAPTLVAALYRIADDAAITIRET